MMEIEPNPKSEESDPISQESDPKSEDSNIKSDGSDPKSEDPNIKSEDSKSNGSDQKSEDSNLKSDGSDPKSDDSDPIAEDSDSKTEEFDPKSEESDPKPSTSHDLSSGSGCFSPPHKKHKPTAGPSTSSGVHERFKRCGVCDLSFVCERDLELHLMLHEGDAVMAERVDGELRIVMESPEPPIYESTMPAVQRMLNANLFDLVPRPRTSRPGTSSLARETTAKTSGSMSEALTKCSVSARSEALDECLMSDSTLEALDAAANRPRDEPLTCGKCGMHLDNDDHFKEHDTYYITHRKCCICKQVFENLFMLNMHYRAKHSIFLDHA